MLLPPFLPWESHLLLPSSPAPTPQSVLAPEANREVDHHGARKQVIKRISPGFLGVHGSVYGDDGDHRGTQKQVPNFFLVVVMLCGGSNGDWITVIGKQGKSIFLNQVTQKDINS